MSRQGLLLLTLGLAVFCNHDVGLAEPSNSEKFRDILSATLAVNASVEAQAASVQAAKAAHVYRSLYWTPTASAALTNQTTSNSTTYTNASTLTVNYNLYKFGAQELLNKATDTRLQAENQRLFKSKEDAEAAVAALLFQVIQAQKNLSIRQSHIDVQQELATVAFERYKLGQLAQQELEKSKLDLDSAKVSWIDAKAALITALGNLRGVGCPADKQPQGILDWPLSVEVAKLPKKPLRTAESFYAVRALQLDDEYYRAQGKASWRTNYLPTLDFSGGWQNLGYGSVQQGQWVGGLTLTIPIFDQLSGLAQVATSDSTAKSAKANAELSLRQAQSALDSLDERLKLAREALAISISGVARLGAIRADDLKRFKMGRSSVNDILLDENRFLDAQAALISAQFTYHQMMVEACHAREETILNCF